MECTKSSEASSLRERFDKKFPVSSDLRTCLNTVHNSYKLFDNHQVTKGYDGHLEEANYVVLMVVLRCVKDILRKNAQN